MVLITAPIAKKDESSSNASDPENPISDQTKPQETAVTAEKPGEEASPPPPPSSLALVRVLERIVFGDDAANPDGGGELERGEFEGLCRVLVRGNQVDYLMSQGGMMMQRIRDDSGASVRIASTDQIPPCAFPGDVVIQVVMMNL